MWGDLSLEQAEAHARKARVKKTFFSENTELPVVKNI
jgi:hypothetical protein